jgi:hypothetical protein
VEWAYLILAPLDCELVSSTHCFFCFSGEVVEWGHNIFLRYEVVFFRGVGVKLLNEVGSGTLYKVFPTADEPPVVMPITSPKSVMSTDPGVADGTLASMRLP